VSGRWLMPDTVFVAGESILVYTVAVDIIVTPNRGNWYRCSGE